MKFLPPEEEIRAQLRELTSQTRELRADLQRLITSHRAAGKAFSDDHRYRLHPEPAPTADDHSHEKERPSSKAARPSKRPRSKKRSAK